MGDVEFFDEDGRILGRCLSGFRKEEMFQYFNKTCLNWQLSGFSGWKEPVKLFKDHFPSRR